MKNILILCTLLFCATLKGQDKPLESFEVDNIRLNLLSDNSLQVRMTLILPKDFHLASNRMVTFTPVLHGSGNEEAILPPVYVYGRKRFIISERKNRMPADENWLFRRNNKEKQVINYETSLPFNKWMDGAEILLEQTFCGCGNAQEETFNQNLSQIIFPKPKVDLPDITYCIPKKEVVKRRIYKGRAFLDFPVDKIVIYPEYRRNAIELARIDSTLKGFKLEQIRSIGIHGYASPESPYVHNAYLAKGRTQALKWHILNKFNLKDSIISTDYTPEDWDGFILFAEQSNLKEKARILEIARSDVHPDTKELRLKQMPGAYNFIKNNWFPALRHSDYEIEYRLPDYTPEQARILVKNNPEQLSVHEMFEAAQLCPRGSAEYYQIIRTAVQTYPDNPDANVNAAAMELERGNLAAAKKYLQKADMNTPEAQRNMKRIILLEENKQ